MFLINGNSYEVRPTGKKGRGIFLRHEIPAGSVIGDYLGEIVKDEDLERLETEHSGACYSLDYLGGNTSLYPQDVKRADVHLINHSCAPNCGTVLYYGHTIVFALRRIHTGEELSFDYGFDAEGSPSGLLHPCHCGAPICRGTMYTSSARLEGYGDYITRVSQGQKYARKRPGTVLKALDKYPEDIPDDSFYNIYANLNLGSRRLTTSRIPPLKTLRRLIRQEGRSLYFDKHSISIWGLHEGNFLAVKGRI